jgi:AAA ATPase domain
VRAWAAVRASSVESRFEALYTTDLAALVGREEEVELLLRRWSKAKTGAGHVVLLSGEAGIGKSRLTAALLERLASEPHTRLRYFCSPQHTDSAFHPIIGQMERAAGLAHDDTPQGKLDKLDVPLAHTSTSKQDAALFTELLSLPNDGRYPALDLAPQQRRQRTLEALTAQLAGLASQQPVLMVFEDAHWIDLTSLEALNRTVDRIKTLPALLIVTFRPEFKAPWVEQSATFPYYFSSQRRGYCEYPPEGRYLCPQRNPGYVRPGFLCLSGRDLNPICLRLGQGRPPRRLRSNINLPSIYRSNIDQDQKAWTKVSLALSRCA